MRNTLAITLIFVLFLTSCRRCKDIDAVAAKSVQEEVLDTLFTDSIPANVKPDIIDITPLSELADTVFVNLKNYNNGFSYDLRYATADNFLKEKVYECGECYTRVKTAKALIAANEELRKKGYRIHFFDCYRPHDVQKKMWTILPNSQYVANPAKGSIHNRGGAVDITLAKLDGTVLDMGTAFDYFGREAYHDYTLHSEEINNNRRLLKETMEKYGFWSVRTEWWHYNLKTTSAYGIANFTWDCED
ncbi:peptidase M15 [Leptobacterium flavescens]|uniref:D-alanyl-D-alanine dipeptidase n=1 Tax=Leptobacterium flavescens TaxID=472055 RepID=A0A6P0UQB9_9FLAO|nr:M15 family metallopeptidase [Leptobacterium flavescens]NER14019.1 peptidase M15 [Leptobacterium flavescens]